MTMSTAEPGWVATFDLLDHDTLRIKPGWRGLKTDVCLSAQEAKDAAEDNLIHIPVNITSIRHTETGEQVDPDTLK